MQKENFITGADLVSYMNNKKLTARDMAAMLNCSRQTIYEWRSKFHDKPILGRYKERLHSLINDDWTKTYKKKLSSFIKDNTRSVIFWQFMRHSGIEEEVFIEPEFCRNEFGMEGVSCDNILYDWNSPNDKPKLIVGSSGSGKTTFVRYAILDCLESEEKPIPFLAPLGLFSAWFKETKNGGFLDFLDYVYSTLSFDASCIKDIISLLKNGEAVLFLDGIDEIRPGLHEDFIRLANQFLRKLGTRKNVIITSRNLNYSIQHQLSAVCSVFQLKSFTQKQTISLANSLLPEHQVNDFLQALTDYAQLKTIARSPLVLSIMLTMFRYASVLEFSEASIVENFFDFIFGKYKGGRSLGGFIEREHELTYLDSPALIRSTVFYLCYHIRKDLPYGTNYPEDLCSNIIREMWQTRKYVPEEAIDRELGSLFLYLRQLGIINNIFTCAPDAGGCKRYFTFSSELFIDWLAAAHLVSNEDDLSAEIDHFKSEHRPSPPSRRRRLFYSFELLNANIGAISKVQKIIEEIYKTTSDNKDISENILHTKFLFVVDCLRRGLISKYDLKRKVRISFRKLFEGNNYALVQKALQARVLILDPGQEYSLSEEEDYVNPFKRDLLPDDWSKDHRDEWKNRILDKRYNECNTAYYRRKERFVTDMSWRYAGQIHELLDFIDHILKIRPGLRSHDHFIYRRFLFSARFIDLKKCSIIDIESLLKGLLEIAHQVGDQYGEIYKYMSLDSFWYILCRLKNLKEFIPKSKFEKLDITDYTKQYFKTAKRHKYFIDNYCNKTMWNIEDLLNDNKAETQYMIIEHEHIRTTICRSLSKHIVIKYLKEIERYSKLIERNPRKMISKENLELLAKTCVFISFIEVDQDSNKDISRFLYCLASATDEYQQSFNIGPRQLYDYAIFALWSLYEHENDETGILPF